MKTIFRAALVSALLLASPACSAEGDASYTDGTIAPAEGFPEGAWRTVEPDNLMLIDTAYGVIGVELYPEVAPLHVAQIKSLIRSGFYDNVPFHRVIEGFMNQTGDGSNGDGTGDSTLPDIQAEFGFRRSEDMSVTMVSARTISGQEIGVGFYKALPVASQPIAQAMITNDGKVAAFGLHCKGVTSMARTNDPNSANSQFFLMRDRADHLNLAYSIWGSTVMGREFLRSFRIGTLGQDPGFVPDQMNRVRMASDLPEADRPDVQVLDPASNAFSNWLSEQTYDDICDIDLPSRTL